MGPHPEQKTEEDTEKEKSRVSEGVRCHGLEPVGLPQALVVVEEGDRAEAQEGAAQE